jgi:hypothetical protein
VSGWIKLEKDLREDRRFTRIVTALLKRQNESVTDVTQMRLLERNTVTQVLGCLAQLWMFADSHIREDDTLDYTLDEIDQLVGVEGFAKLMPSDWLEVLDENRIRLPDFQAHNGTDAKKKALTAKRVKRHRTRSAVSSETHEKRTSVTDALPDQTRLDQKRPDQEERETRTPEVRGVRDCGSGLTTIGETLDCWRRDVPECSSDAFARWIVHCETSGKVLGAAQRLGQAKLLAGNGDFAAQAEVVDYCISQGWKTLLPLCDVRARRDGMSRTGPVTRRPHTPSPTTAELEAQESARARS